MKQINTLIFIALLSLIMASVPYSTALSISKNEWQAGNIIDDPIFTDKNAMSVAQIQGWLDSKLRNCDTAGSQKSEIQGGIDYDGNGIVSRHEYGKTKGNPSPFTCLNAYYEVPKKSPNNTLPANNYGGKPIPSGALSAAEIIHDAAQTYNISPKVLLVKLGTESAGPLTHDTWPFEIQYKYAMGARCPDSGVNGSPNCDEQYAGFSIQMYEGAKLLRWYLDNVNEPWWPYRKPNATNFVLWNVVETQCGGSNVYIENSATAALYTYTPYQPNNAALNNLYGTGDRCSAYGNRNFWRVYNDWFGATRLPSIKVKVYDDNTSTAGDTARIGFALEKKPRANVTMTLAISSPSNAVIKDSRTSITITPDTWNDFSKNEIVVIGKNNPNLSSTTNYTLITGDVSSGDSRFNQMSATETPDIPLIGEQSIPSPVHELYLNDQEAFFYTSNKATYNNRISQGWQDLGVLFHTCPATGGTIGEYRRDSDSRLVILNSREARELRAVGYDFMGQKFSVDGGSKTAIYHFYNNTTKKSRYSTNNTPTLSDGYVNQGIVFYGCDTESLPVYRLKKVGGSHFYTTSTRERDKAHFTLDYKYEGAPFQICKEVQATVPVYRFLREDKGIRFYTSSQKEYDRANELGYRYEGVGFKVCNDTDGIAMYRLYNKKNGRRLYTTSKQERDSAVTIGYTYEGVAFRVR